MLQSLKSEHFYDPAYRESIMRSPSGRGLFFAPDAIKRVNKTIETILSSVELHRLNFVSEDPFCTITYPSVNYTAFNQLIGTLYLSDLCRSRIFVDGIMFYQWLLDRNLLEEYIMSLLFCRILQFPHNRILANEKPFCDTDKGEVVRDLLNGNNSGAFCNKWKEKFAREGQEINPFQAVKNELAGNFDEQKVIRIIQDDSNLDYELQVINLFVNGEFSLAQIDRTFRLAFSTGKNFGMLNIDDFFQNVEISNENEKLKISVADPEASKQMFRFYTTYYDVLLPEAILHQDVCFYRGLFRRNLRQFIDGKDKKENGKKLAADILFLTDFELWRRFENCQDNCVSMILSGERYKAFYRKEVECSHDKSIELAFKTLPHELELPENALVVDVVTPGSMDQRWLNPSILSEIKRHATDKRFQNIGSRINKCHLSFFSMKDIDHTKFKETIDEIFK